MPIPAEPLQVTLRVSSGPDAPTLTIDLQADALAGPVSGNALIAGAPPPADGQITIPQVTGYILNTSRDEVALLVHLSGQYIVWLPPPAIGSYIATFSAALMVDSSWSGSGSYHYNFVFVGDCTVALIAPDG